MIEYADAVQRFHTELLSSWAVVAKYTLPFLSCRSLDLAMDGTHQEKEIVTFSGLTNWNE